MRSRAIAKKQSFSNSVSGWFAWLHPPTTMLRLCWQTYPAGFVGMVGLDLIQNFVPLAQAWITKLIFDGLAVSFQAGDGVLPSSLWFLLAGQVGLQLLSQVIGSISGYLGAELNRRLSLQVQLNIHGKINSLQGLAIFEDSKTYDARSEPQ